MDLLDRLLGHDAWTTGQLLEIASTLTEEQLDRKFDIGHQALRRTFDHIIHNMEAWSSLMQEKPIVRQTDCSIPGLQQRLRIAADRLATIARTIANENAWDRQWCDVLDDPPQYKSFGTAIAHVITHSMHHRAQILYMLRHTGIENLPEGDVFSWETAGQPGTSGEH